MKITRKELRRMILKEMLSDDPTAPVNRMSIEDSTYEYNKNMFYTQISGAADQFIESSRGRFDSKMKLRIMRGIARVLGDSAVYIDPT